MCRRPAITQAARPVYLRLHDLVVACILDGRFAEGTLLPSVRALAAQEGVNPLTVAKAYQQFLAWGLVEVRRGVGMEVLPGAAARLRERERDRFLREEWPALRARMALLNLSPHDLAESV